VHLGLPEVASARRELDALGTWDGPRALPPRAETLQLPAPAVGQAVLATWHLLLDDGRLQDGEKFLAATARRPVARLSAATAREIGVREGETVAVSTDAGSILLPLEIAELPDRVVWLPTNSPGSHVRATLSADTGSIVALGQVATATTVLESGETDAPQEVR
jgi:NADH-quinone oxidoreductase subunit G